MHRGFCDAHTRAYVLTTLGILLTVLALLTLSASWTGVYRGARLDQGPFTPSLFSGAGAGDASGERECGGGKRALIYTKSPKTASSFIQNVLVNWTEATGRPLYQCYRAPLLTLANIQSCLPPRPDPCGVFSCHVFLEPFTSRLFAHAFPNHLLATSTRYPPHRIVSMFLFSRKMRDDDPRVAFGLARFIAAWNPWTLYNYHTGESRTGACPLSEDEKRDVYSVASRFHVVVDANARLASNVILRRFALFNLPLVNVEDRDKERGAVRVNMTDDLLNALRNVACVEEHLHRAFQIRMARLYEEASDRECILDPRMPIPDTCIEREERESLKGYWRL